MFVRENQHISKGVGKRLFLSVLVTYLLLLIAAISLPVFGYFYSIRQSQQEMEALQISYLGQIQREFDLRLNSIFKINKFLASYPLTKSISEMDEEQVSNQTFYHSLNEVIVEQNTLLGNDGQTVIYFAHSDSVLTGEYRYRSENLDAYTKQLGLSPAEFRVFLSEGAATGSLRILHPGTAEAELTYLVPVYDENFQKVGTVMTRLSMSLLQKELNVSSWAEGSVCHMENGEEVFYIDNGGFANTASEVPDYSQVPLDATPVKNQIQGEDFITVGLRSSVNTWKYYFSIPSQEFFSIQYVLSGVVLRHPCREPVFWSNPFFGFQPALFQADSQHPQFAFIGHFGGLSRGHALPGTRPIHLQRGTFRQQKPAVPEQPAEKGRVYLGPLYRTHFSWGLGFRSGKIPPCFRRRAALSHLFQIHRNGKIRLLPKRHH